jgi:hypothetical protein
MPLWSNAMTSGGCTWLAKLPATDRPRSTDIKHFADQIMAAMQSASIDAQIVGYGNLVGGDYPAMACWVGANKMDLIKALAKFLATNHLIPGRLPVEQVNQPDRLDCTIASW